MKLSLTLTDQRVEQPATGYAYSTNRKYEDYSRVSIADAEMSGPVLAGVLRAIADDLDGLELVRSEVSA